MMKADSAASRPAPSSNLRVFGRGRLADDADVVEVVAGAVHVAAAAAEAGQRAVDDRFREVVRPDAETLDDARPVAID